MEKCLLVRKLFSSIIMCELGVNVEDLQSYKLYGPQQKPTEDNANETSFSL